MAYTVANPENAKQTPSAGINAGQGAKQMNIKDANYYVVHGFMLNRLGLKGTALNVYAIIYGFSQDGESEFKGSRTYLCDFTGATRPTIDKALEDLTERGLITKTTERINNVAFNKYKANLDAVKNFTGCKETLQGGCKETLPNINIINNKNIIQERKGTFDLLIDKYIEATNGSAEVKDLLGEWLKVRKAKRAPLTDKAIELNLQKLDGFARESNLTVAEYLKEVISRGWQAFYPIKNYTGQKQAEQTREFKESGINKYFDDMYKGLTEEELYELL